MLCYVYTHAHTEHPKSYGQLVYLIAWNQTEDKRCQGQQTSPHATLQGGAPGESQYRYTLKGL